MATLGQQFREAREKVGLTVEEAAAQTNIRREHLNALEADDLASLPGLPFARGFIRIYADLLKLDADVLLDAYTRQVGSTDPGLTAQPSTQRTRSAAVPAALVLTIALVTIVVVVAALNRPEELPQGRQGAASGIVTETTIPTGARVELVAAREVQVTVMVDDRIEFEGLFGSESRRSWFPEDSFEIRTPDPVALSLWVDGQDLGRLGASVEMTTRIWQIVTPAANAPVAGPRQPRT